MHVWQEVHQGAGYGIKLTFDEVSPDHRAKSRRVLRVLTAGIFLAVTSSSVWVISMAESERGCAAGNSFFLYFFSFYVKKQKLNNQPEKVPSRLHLRARDTKERRINMPGVPFFSSPLCIWLCFGMLRDVEGRGVSGQTDSWIWGRGVRGQTMSQGQRKLKQIADAANAGGRRPTHLLQP